MSNEKVWFEGTVQDAIDQGLGTEDLDFLVGIMVENKIDRIKLSNNDVGSYSGYKIKMVANEEVTEGYVEIVKENKIV